MLIEAPANCDTPIGELDLCHHLVSVESQTMLIIMNTKDGQWRVDLLTQQYLVIFWYFLELMWNADLSTYALLCPMRERDPCK
jgi:hypothetical protein